MGSTGFGVIGSTDDGPEEIEHAPALSLTLAGLPSTHMSLTHITNRDLPDGDAPPEAWARVVGLAGCSGSQQEPPNFVILSDPSFGRLDDLIYGLDYAFQQSCKIGGLTSAGRLSSARATFAWQSNWAPDRPTRLRTGAVVLALHGGVSFDLVVAQGCRPLSDTVYTIDQVTGPSMVLSVISSKGGGPMTPVEALQRELSSASRSKEQLKSLLLNMTLGVAPEGLTPLQQPLEPHDFLIRGMALDKAGFMVAGDALRAGQRFRFMVRDRAGAKEDLKGHGLAYKRRELAAALAGSAPPPAFGMLLFSCNGRGTNLYDEPHYDSRTLASYVPVPCSGFMCNGEIGTIGTRTKIHGFTCAAAVLRVAPVRGNQAAGGGMQAGASTTQMQQQQQQQQQQQAAKDMPGSGGELSGDV